jgi:UDP-N-acetylglucosamine/UDP-N-acetylgalactosamine 4-epimerase
VLIQYYEMHKILITGGAGFIGSNLAKALLAEENVSLVRVLDNLSNGFYQNIEALISNPKFEFVQGDICDYGIVAKAMDGITVVSHQAALGSVPRSVKDPITTNNININGTLNVFTAAKEAGVNRVVYAASSSTYGDSEGLPKIEDVIGRPLSPYAITKYVMELYADVFKRIYNLDTIGLRYFNVFGPNQSPTGAYAAVIPLFMESVITSAAPTINGDGSNSRDFTFVGNVVQANIKALFTENEAALNQIYNIAYGSSTTLTELFDTICAIAKSDLKANYGPNRIGDIPHSLANIDKAKSLLEYLPTISVSEGLATSFEWYKNNPTYFESAVMQD